MRKSDLLLALITCASVGAAAAFYHKANVAEQKTTMVMRQYACSVEASLAKTIAQARDQGLTRAELPLDPRDAHVADWVYSQKLPPSAVPELWEARCLS